MTGPEHYEEGERLLAEAAERDEEGAALYGEERQSDPAVRQLTSRAHEHLVAAQTAVLAAALLPDSVSWRKVLER